MKSKYIISDNENGNGDWFSIICVSILVIVMVILEVLA